MPHSPCCRAQFSRLNGRSVVGLIAFLLAPFCVVQAQTIPSGGVSLLSGDLATTGGFYAHDLGDGPIAERTVVSVSGQTFSQAARVATTKPTGDHWRSAIGMKANRSVSQGDVVLLHFFMRAIETSDESGQVTAQVYVEGPEPNYVSSLSETISAGSEWTEFFVPLTVVGNYASGGLAINFGFGSAVRPQVLELGGVEALWYGTTRTLAEMPRTSFSYDGRAADAPWRAEAAARIEQHRKGDITVNVVGANGAPVAGAHVRVRQRRHAFEFGTAFVGSRVLDQTDANNAVYREKLLELFNAGSFENDLKWAPWIGEWGSSFSPAIVQAALEWAHDHDLAMRGHVLVWPSTRNMPTALTSAILADDPSIPGTILAHIDDIIDGTKTYVNEWDVLNEPYDNHDIMDRYGNQQMVEWFKRARAKLPTAELYINDYAILSGNGLNVDKQDAYEETIRFIRDGGGPLTGIGFQGHFSGAATGITRMWSILQRYATAFPDAKFRITEFDHTTNDEELQADFLRDFLTLAFSHPQMQGVQLWGFWAGAHWRESAALYRLNWEEKPNAAAYRALVLGEWWTDHSARTSAGGAVSTRGFAGAYTAEVTVGGATRAQDFELTKTGNAITVTLDAPVITTPPVGAALALGGSTTLAVTATGTGPLAYQWRRNGIDIAGATSATLALSNVEPADAGLYTVAVAGAGGVRVSDGAVVGVTIPTKVEGTGMEFAGDIAHANGIYDQMLITGPAMTYRADPGQVVRTSFVDPNDDIVQVEFAGAGWLTIELADVSGPATPAAYNQAINYMKGRATITIVGADETSNVTIFTVGRQTAGNQTLFKADWNYDGLADVALLNIRSETGRFGGVRAANARFSASSGLTGVNAPGVAFGGPFFVHDVVARETAKPVLLTGTIGISGAGTDGGIGITGGDMLQPNHAIIALGDASFVEMRAGSSSHGIADLPQQTNAGFYDRSGVDVTSTIVR